MQCNCLCIPLASSILPLVSICPTQSLLFSLFLVSIPGITQRAGKCLLKVGAVLGGDSGGKVPESGSPARVCKHHVWLWMSSPWALGGTAATGGSQSSQANPGQSMGAGSLRNPVSNNRMNNNRSHHLMVISDFYTPILMWTHTDTHSHTLHRCIHTCEMKSEGETQTFHTIKPKLTYHQNTAISEGGFLGGERVLEGSMWITKE